MDADPEAALRSARDTLEWSLRHRGPESPMTLDAKAEVAQKLERLGRFDDVLALRGAGRRLPGEVRWEPTNPTRWRPRRCKGSTSIDWVDTPRRCPSSSTSWRNEAATLGADDASTCAAMEWLGCTLRYLGDLLESRRLLEEAVEGYTRQGAGETEDCMKAMSHLATTLTQLELVPEACGSPPAHRRRAESDPGCRRPRTLSSQENLAATLMGCNEFDEADVIGRSLLEKRVRPLGENDADTLRTRSRYGNRSTPGPPTRRNLTSDRPLGRPSRSRTVARPPGARPKGASERTSWPTGPDLATTPPPACGV